MSKFQRMFVNVAAVGLITAVTAGSASAYWGGLLRPWTWGCGPVCGPVCGPICGPVCGPVCGPICGPVCDPCFSCDPCGGDYMLGVRPGPIRRLLFGTYRYYGGYGCFGGAPFYDGYAASDCCGAVSENTVTDPVTIPAPTSPAPAPAPAPTQPSVVEPSSGDNLLRTTSVNGPVFYRASYTQQRDGREFTADQSGLITIYVPQDARVFVNGSETTSRGSKRTFVSYGLELGSEYDYTIQAEVIRDGQRYTQTQVVTLQAGSQQRVTFPFESLNPLPPEVMAGY